MRSSDLPPDTFPDTFSEEASSPEDIERWLDGTLNPLHDGALKASASFEPDDAILARIQQGVMATVLAEPSVPGIPSSPSPPSAIAMKNPPPDVIQLASRKKPTFQLSRWIVPGTVAAACLAVLVLFSPLLLNPNAPQINLSQLGSDAQYPDRSYPTPEEPMSSPEIVQAMADYIPVTDDSEEYTYLYNDPLVDWVGY